MGSPRARTAGEGEGGRDAESCFSAAEIAYLTGRRLGRIATVGADGAPHVVPVGMIAHDPGDDAIEVRGRDLAATKKFRDAERRGRAAIVVDDIASTDPWRPRGIEVRGRAEAVREPESVIRIHPERIVAWGIEGGRGARSVATADGERE